ncbi:hypothetical protein BU15DRAFT_57622 [Melanogaster broomeanus]|nr:hypothetical protein BU15DRAFT_57622 [Melanogaster broomeanus]
MLAPPPIPSRIRKVPVPYHTSILSGQQWVLELLDGHPGCIRCELGMHCHVFIQLICELWELGHCNSRFVSLEDQVAIFLYMSVMGLTTRHVAERFQWATDTISK